MARAVNVAQVAIEEVRDYIKGKFVNGMLPAQPRAYRETRSKLAQEAHEAIRPTSVFREPDLLRPHLTPEQYRFTTLCGSDSWPRRWPRLSSTSRSWKSTASDRKAAVSLPRQWVAPEVCGLPHPVSRRSGRGRD